MAMTLAKLAGLIEAQVRGDDSRAVDGCAGLDEAGPRQVSFLANQKYAGKLAGTGAGAVIVSDADAAACPPALTLLIASDPYFAFRQAVVELHGFRRRPEPGVHETAIVHASATLGRGVAVQPYAVIAEDAAIGDRTVIYPHCYIGPRVRIGQDCLLYPSVTVYDDCVLGDRVTLHAGCVIGQDGFGYATHQSRGEALRHHKIPQIGNAVIEDDVELGAGCAVDRATVGSTLIGAGTKFSNLIAIGHGAEIGRHNLFVAQVGIAGSTQTGDYVVMGGQVGVAGHLRIGAGSQLAAKAGVMTDVPAGEKWGGAPAMPLTLAKRAHLALRKVADLSKDIRELQKRIDALEAALRGGAE